MENQFLINLQKCPASRGQTSNRMFTGQTECETENRIVTVTEWTCFCFDAQFGTKKLSPVENHSKLKFQGIQHVFECDLFVIHGLSVPAARA